jgi:hypothetical protein
MNFREDPVPEAGLPRTSTLGYSEDAPLAGCAGLRRVARYSGSEG